MTNDCPVFICVHVGPWNSYETISYASIDFDAAERFALKFPMHEGRMDVMQMDPEHTACWSYDLSLADDRGPDVFDRRASRLGQRWTGVGGLWESLP